MVNEINKLILDSLHGTVKPTVSGMTVAKLRAVRDALRGAEIARTCVPVLVQKRFPRSKKRRIRKKWHFDPRNWRLEWAMGWEWRP